MRELGFIWMTLVAMAVAWAAPAHAQDASGAGRHIDIRLVAETDRPAAGSSVALALDQRPQPGWHGYWQNPGDAGFPAKLDWTLPRGVEPSGMEAYPLPTTLKVAGLMNYVYEAPFAVLTALKIPAGLAPGTRLPVRLALSYLVCTRAVCVPESADLSLDLTVGDGAIDPDRRARFDTWRRALPQGQTPGSYARVGDRVTIAIPYPRNAALSDAYFFPTSTDAVDYAAPQRIDRDGDRVLIETRAARLLQPGQVFGGVLRIAPGRGLTISAVPGNVAPLPDRSAGSPIAPAGGALGTILAAFGAAVLGGLILNVMPCVFPILSLKALSLARAGGDERGARHEALAYTVGAVAMCLALGGVILSLRAGGSAAGWAFQLQDPRVVVVLMLLSVAIALNFAGMFELPVPRFAASAGGAGGAFATGALAAFVATPCTGPFMGAALGAALVLPWPAALAIFAGLGLGLALPFLLLGFVPALRRLLPRPGPWLGVARRILSIPMWLTAIALAWVLGRQAGVDGMALALFAALALGVVLWAAGRRQARGLGFSIGDLGVMLAITVLATITIHHAPASAPIRQAAGAEAFSEARLDTLRQAGRPVFVYFTADWCLTCKVNERLAIDTDTVRARFAADRVAVLVGDWTDGDPVLGRFITAHNRAGVPLYLYYPAGGGAARVLPQILTPGLLTSLPR